MNEQLIPQKETHQATPRDFAYFILRSKSIESTEAVRPKAGDVIMRDGVELMFVPELRWTRRLKDGVMVNVQAPYTYQQFYSHSFEDPKSHQWECGPGHDTKFSLFDDEAALRAHGRTFTSEELKDLPTNLPTDDVLFLGKFGDDRVEDYLIYLAQQKK